MKKTDVFILIVLLLMVIVLPGCSQNISDNYGADNETLFQVSTLNALMLGDYDGLITVDTLLQSGNTGLGTFDTLDGEMIVLNGTVYQAKADGSVTKPDGNVTVPFAAVTHFDPDISFKTQNVSDIEALKSILADQASDNPNIFYMATISGDFDMVHVRSVYAQEKPYKPLAEVAESQKEFEYENISGTLVALYCPDYVSGINLYGWHIHFISSDGSKGGHVLDVAIKAADAQVDLTNAYKIVLPDTQDFASLSLANDMQSATTKVEGKK